MIYSENILVCMAVPLLLTLFFVKDNARQFVLNFLLGMAACLLGAYVSGFLDVATGMGVEDTAVFISPFTEETMKFLPLLFYFLMFEPQDDRLFHAAVGIGAGFASYENVCSMVSSGAGSLGFLMIRGLAVGVMHIVSVFALMLGLVIARRLKAMRFASVVGALSLSMLFHGTYNLPVSKPGITSAIGYVLPLATAVILLSVYRSLQTAE
jgi:RsiW-degrading membrane proteinase PrsW (M82 family)